MARHTRTIGISRGREHLEVDGEAWFLLADTIWSAFTHVPSEDWAAYLLTRRRQGFNALLISALPILHDLSEARELAEPFAGFWSGAPAFGPLLPAYLDVMRARLDVAMDHGFTPIIVDVWCNYAPETWASRRRPEYVMPAQALPEYLGSLAEAVAPYEPIHLVSGDADFEEAASINFYEQALHEIKRLAPTCLTGLHLQPEAVLPDVLADAEALDVYVYQSGHHLELQQLAYELAERYLARPVRRPVLNIEPPYDGHGHGFRYGRFDARAVRRASWQSILSGASAGLGYGAHGVWQWHDRDAGFNHADFSGTPFDHATALAFAGAWDVGFLKFLVERLGLMRSVPAQDDLGDVSPEIRAATSHDGRLTAVYAPYATELTLDIDDAVLVERWNLETRAVETVELREGDKLDIPLPDWIGDSLTVIHRSGGR